MTWLAWWRSVTARPESQASVAPVRESQRPVPAEYLGLYTYLERRYASVVVLTFEQMESLMGFALPDAARTEPDWWTSVTSSRDRHSDAWIVASRTATPHLSAKIVTFERLA